MEMSEKWQFWRLAVEQQVLHLRGFLSFPFYPPRGADLSCLSHMYLICHMYVYPSLSKSHCVVNMCTSISLKSAQS